MCEAISICAISRYINRERSGRGRGEVFYTNITFPGPLFPFPLSDGRARPESDCFFVRASASPTSTDHLKNDTSGSKVTKVLNEVPHLTAAPLATRKIRLHQRFTSEQLPFWKPLIDFSSRAKESATALIDLGLNTTRSVATCQNIREIDIHGTSLFTYALVLLKLHLHSAVIWNIQCSLCMIEDRGRRKLSEYFTVANEWRRLDELAGAEEDETCWIFGR